ncbi:hypothetical protein RIF29_05734 [Crotalaria pallida]|uniref:Uncharacterized protein n=1 Tax=Crotalaria pallida TaxID=3830 RepID=A0AAN9J3E4_CROPI
MVAQMEDPSTHKLVEQSQVTPAAPLDPKASTTKSLPLTFLDLPLAGPVYVRRQFFYHFPYPTHHFYETILPNLKHSLSLTLQYFFPLAGILLCPPPPHKPFIRCTNDDYVTLTILESAADFDHLSSNHPKNLKDLDHLVPELTCTTMHDHENHDHDHDDTFMFPLLALKATVFPNRGLCIAITYCHIIDDRCCGHFMKSWSSISQTGGVDFIEKSTPCFDREVLKDPKELEAIFLRDYFNERSTWKDKLIGQISKHDGDNNDEEDYVKATILFSKEDIEVLKKWVLNEWKKNNNKSNVPQSLSKFVVTCAFVWASLVKTRYRNDDQEDETKEEYFRFSADCRDRLEYPIPGTYFGNCITRCHAILKRKDLKGEGGFLNAVKVIERAVCNMKDEPFEDAENWRATFTKMFVLGSVVLVTGSPKFSVYETDFGFGRPTKVEMVHSFKCMSLAESGDREGGLEVGLIFRSNKDFEHYVSIIEQGLEALKS